MGNGIKGKAFRNLISTSVRKLILFQKKTKFKVSKSWQESKGIKKALGNLELWSALLQEKITLNMQLSPRQS
jgi:hypothetical protein